MAGEPLKAKETDSLDGRANLVDVYRTDCGYSKPLGSSYSRSILVQTTDRRVAHVVGPRDVGQHLPRLTARNCFTALVSRQFWLSAKNNPPCLRTFASLPGPGADQFAFKLGKAAQNGQHQAPMRCRGVGPVVPKRFEASLLLPDCPEQIQEIACGSRQNPGSSSKARWTSRSASAKLSRVDRTACCTARR